MKLEKIFEDPRISADDWLTWDGEAFVVVSKKPKNKLTNREVLARSYLAIQKTMGGELSHASRILRNIWTHHQGFRGSRALPGVISSDGFLCQYALGKPLSVEQFRDIWSRATTKPLPPPSRGNPIHIEWNADATELYDVDATPPGFLPKLFPYFRLRKDKILLSRVIHDLHRLALVENNVRRRFLVLAVLSHAAAYREIDGKTLQVPHFDKQRVLVGYTFTQHLIADGSKTFSLVPDDPTAPPIYLCQGTELWPSQSSMLGSILTNFARHGSSTEAYAHSWRRIHKHLRALANDHLPYVAGHSMGGALAMQMSLYSHSLIEKAYAFNPPLPHERDYDFYHQMAPELRQKMIVSTNLDDFAFWRIGARIIGNVTIFMGKKRWRYYPIHLIDFILIIPVLIKFFFNVRHAFPAHQAILPLSEQFTYIRLSQEEVERENQERITRFDYLRFFPKLYDPSRTVVRLLRRIFGWGLEEEYLRSEIEIVALHERDLLDTLENGNVLEIDHQLHELRRQKELLIKRLNSLR